jgi:hypothetical protein
MPLSQWLIHRVCVILEAKERSNKDFFFWAYNQKTPGWSCKSFVQNISLKWVNRVLVIFTRFFFIFGRLNSISSKSAMAINILINI